MKNILNTSLLIITGILLTSCTTEVDINDHIHNLTPIELMVKSKYDSIEFVDRPVILLTTESEEFKKLIDWGSNNTEGWEPSIASYAMADAYLIQTDFYFSYYKSGFVILKFKDKDGKHRQFKKQINEGELDFLFN